VIFDETPTNILPGRDRKASDLILRTDLPITEVCFEVGFSSLSSFSWLLKQKYGMSPENMRETYNSFQIKLAGFKK
jgi:AraC-like DNA-binding protein